MVTFFRPAVRGVDSLAGRWSSRTGALQTTRHFNRLLLWRFLPGLCDGGRSDDPDAFFRRAYGPRACPRRRGVTGRTAFTTVRVINRVLDDTTDVRALALPAHAAALPQLMFDCSALPTSPMVARPWLALQIAGGHTQLGGGLPSDNLHGVPAERHDATRRRRRAQRRRECCAATACRA